VPAIRAGSKKMKKVASVCIVGGGSAGWMTASLLRKQLPPHFEVSIIDPPTIPSVGVGEATLLNFGHFMEQCGFNEAQWIDEVEGLYKCGIVFEDWVKENHKIWHSFSGLQYVDQVSSVSLHKNTSEAEDYASFSRKCLTNYTCSVENNKVHGGVGYHLNAKKLALFLKKNTVGVKLFEEAVEKVEHTDSEIDNVILKDGTIVKADLFVNCTGWSSVLSEVTKSAKWVDRSGDMPVNIAVAAPVEYADEALEMRPYTTAKCLDIGWMWVTPIQSRIGAGIIFNSSITSVEEAKSKFESIWGDRRLAEFNVLRWEPKFNSESWLGNVVSVGLSSGFVEPLESSGLALIGEAGYSLLGRIRKGFYNTTDVLAHNARLALKYEETMDFVRLHYLNSTYASKFWKMVKEQELSESLVERINMYEKFGYSNTFLPEGAIFSEHSWVSLFEGVGVKGCFPSGSSATDDLLTLNHHYANNELYRHRGRHSNFELLQMKKDVAQYGRGTPIV
jgi:tryptophan 7-halogenase